jgi:adenylate cyclase
MQRIASLLPIPHDNGAERQERVQPNRGDEADHYARAMAEGLIEGIDAASLASFVPSIATTGDQVDDDRSYEAIVAFLDLSGFTPLAEAIAVDDLNGAERLAAIINGLFDPLIGVVQACGGDVVAFEGDSVTAVIPRSTVTDVAAVLRELRSAVEHVEALPPVTTALGPHSLHVHGGVSAGLVRHVTLGAEGSRLLALLGAPVSAAASLQAEARAGELKVDPRLFEPTGLITAGRPASAGGHPIADFAPHRVRELLLLGQRRFLDEYRPVTIVFVRLRHADVADLRRQVDVAQRIIADSGGHLLRVAIGDKGTVCLATWGAPLAVDDGASSALRAALRMTRHPNVDAGVGIASGVVFCGLVGAPRRWSYGVVGDAANTAARLMDAAAPSTVLATHDVVRGARCVVEHGSVVNIAAKGKSQPVPVVHVTEVRGASAATDIGLSSGRHQLCDQLSAAVGTALAGHGAVVAVHGAAGVGKSRLIAAAIEDLDEVTVIEGAADESDGPTWYRLWHQAIATLLGAVDLDGAGSSLSERGDLLLPVLGRAPHASRPFERSESIISARHDAVADVLAARSRARSLLIIVRAGDTIDASSVALLDHLARSTRRLPVAIIVETSHMFELAGEVATIAVEPLADHDRAAAAIEMTRAAGLDLSAMTIDELAARCEGNPLHLALLVDDLAAGRPFDDLGPAGLRTLVTARLDRLDAATRTVAGAASVLGAEFDIHELNGAFGAILAPQLDDAAQSLVGAGLWATSAPGRYRFGSRVLRTTAYESMARRTRSELHLAAGLHYEQVSQSTGVAVAETLAIHFGHTDDVGRQRRYFIEAADQAAAVYASETAALWYHRAIEVVETWQRPHVLIGLAAVAEAAGDFGGVETYLAEARRDVEASVRAPDHQASAWTLATVALGRVLAMSGRLAEAAAVLDQIDLDAQVDHGTAHGDAVLADLLDAQGLVAANRGDYARGTELAEQQLVVRRRLDDRAGEAAALALRANMRCLGGTSASRDDLIASGLDDIREALALLDAGREQVLALELANDYAALQLDSRQLVEALAGLVEARRNAERVGNRYLQGMMLTNESYIRLRLGDISGARIGAHAALDLCYRSGAHRLIVLAFGVYAASHHEAGDHLTAAELFGQVGALAEQFSEPAVAFLARVSAAEAFLAARDLTAAEAALPALGDPAHSPPEHVARHLSVSVQIDVLLGRQSDTAGAARLAHAAAELGDLDGGFLLVADAIRLHRPTARDTIDLDDIARRAVELHKRTPELQIRGLLEALGRAVPNAPVLGPVTINHEPEPIETLLSWLSVR